jgi:hypothetical protein
VAVLWAVRWRTRATPARRKKVWRAIGLAVVNVLIFLAALIAGFTLATTIFLILWMLLMLILTLVTGQRHDLFGVPGSLIAAVAAASLGAGLSIGGGPVIEAARVGSVALTVEARGCDSAFVIDESAFVRSGATIAGDGTPQEIELLPLAIFVEPEENRIRISSEFGIAQSFPLDGVESVNIDGILIDLDTEQKIQLKDHDGARIVITCAGGTGYRLPASVLALARASHALLARAPGAA